MMLGLTWPCFRVKKPEDLKSVKRPSDTVREAQEVYLNSTRHLNTLTCAAQCSAIPCRLLAPNHWRALGPSAANGDCARFKHVRCLAYDWSGQRPSWSGQRPSTPPSTGPRRQQHAQQHASRHAPYRSR